VFSWGKGALGRLGHGNDETQASPKVVAALVHVTRRGDRVVSVGCGGAHSGCITSAFHGVSTRVSWR
jgi:alpha-tubulin suppressor-like RCC1 family protein